MVTQDTKLLLRLLVGCILDFAWMLIAVSACFWIVSKIASLLQ
jgi:hypothetical protein